MFYVYIIQSLKDVKRRYVGVTGDLQYRLSEHNSGESVHTNKYVPWKLVTYIAFDSKEKAAAVAPARRSLARRWELYLKSGSGRSFSKRHL